MNWMVRLVVIAVGMHALGMAASSAHAADYPNKPIRFVVPLPPGGMTDALARLVAQKLTESWGQSVTVDNRGGGSTIIGSEIVAKAPPDGYTILLVGPALVINPSLRSNLPYDAEKSFAPVSLLAFSPMVLVADSSLAVNTVGELVSLAKSRPGQLNYGSGGNATGAQLAGELLKRVAGVDMIHVPYKGVGPAVVGLLSGQVSLMFAQMPIVRPHIQSGKLRALAVASGTPSQAMPELPTMAQAGFPGFKVDVWFGIVAPAGTPGAIVSRLNGEIRKIMQMPDVVRRLVPEGAEPATNTPEEFAALIRSNIAISAELVKKVGARVD